MIKSNYIVYDTETGGLYPEKNPITQFACIVLDLKTLKEVDRWETFVKPYNDLTIEKDALEHTMVSMSDINNGISLKDFINTASTFLEQHRAKSKTREKGRLVPVGHNIPFDNNMLEYAFNLRDKSIYDYIQPNFIDTLPLAKLVWGLEGYEKINLGACCERAKINLTDAHGAMNDVEATADLLRFFMKRLRAKKGDTVSEIKKRETGTHFFEFSCGA